MKQTTTSALILFLLLPVMLFAATDRMTYEEYEQQLQMYVDREQTAMQQIESVNAEIERLQGEITTADNQIAENWDAVYTMLDTDKRDLDTYLSDVERIHNNFKRYESMSLEELKRNGEAVARDLKKYEEYAQDMSALYPDAEGQLQEVGSIVDALERNITQMPLEYLSTKYYPASYSVVRGDCLWNIAKKPQIYNDPFKWTWIYDANKDQISDPDLIYPGQVFAIPRDRLVRQSRFSPEELKTQYTVTRGDYLSKIAGYPQIYNNPAKWKLIYEANNDQIKDPNLVYPGQVFDIPYDR